MLSNLKNWWGKRVIEPTTALSLAVLLGVFFPGDGETIKDSIETLMRIGPDLFMAIGALAGVFMSEKGHAKKPGSSG